MYGGVGATGPALKRRRPRYPAGRNLVPEQARGLGALDRGAIFRKCYQTSRGRCIRRYGNSLVAYACTEQAVAPCYAYAATVRDRSLSPPPGALAPSAQKGIGEYFAGMGEYFAGMGADDAAAAAAVSAPASPAPEEECWVCIAAAIGMMLAVGAAGGLAVHLVTRRS